MVLLTFFVCIFVTMCAGEKKNSLKLEQVLIFSRHNIRTPLTTNLEDYTPYTWPKFTEAGAQLTQKGYRMESYIAEYIAEWLTSEEFIKGCPKPEEVLIYSNTLSRTINTAKSFAESAFRYCNVSIYHDKNINVFDPVFHLIFHIKSEHFVQKIIKEMEQILNETDLTDSYLELNRILDIQNSNICKEKKLCDLSINKTQVVYEEGEEPNVNGSLHIGNSVVDAFLMSFYEGFPLENVAWGKIKNEEQWELLARIIRLNQKVRFSTTASQDFGQPLLEYMFNIFKIGKPKFTALFGHDSNFNVIITALNFKQFNRPNQYEPFPIGGKLVFQKWSEGGKSFLKVEYVYSTFSQVRNGDRLSSKNPPQKVVLELNDCEIDDRGLCPWEEFINLNLRSYLST